MKKFLTKRNVVLLVMAAVLVGGFLWFRGRNAGQQIVELATVERRDIELTLIASGKIAVDRQATLNFLSPGKLAYVNVQEGQLVSRGQTLMGLNIGDLRAAETAAYYNYLSADANAKQVEDDLKGKDTTETFAEKNERVAAQTARDKAYDAWLTARRAVSNANLFSPFNGVVTEVTAQAVGDTVGVMDGVTVVDPSSLYFEIEIDESDLGRVKTGMSVEITLDAYDGESFFGTISDIGFSSRLSDSGATVFPAKIRFSSSDINKFRLGMNGDAEMVLEQIENTLALPVESVSDSQVVLPNNETKEVKTGFEGDDYVQIVEGLNEGDQVIR
jgi:HlyD family secretion protein